MTINDILVHPGWKGRRSNDSALLCKPSRFKCLTFAIIVLSISMPIMAWGPVAHFMITKKAGFADVAQYAQMPDYASDWILAGQNFCWAHGVQNTSTGLIPEVPSYPDQGQYPGPDMLRYISMNSSEAYISQNSQDMRSIALGFIAHNAADRPVHWKWFLGWQGQWGTESNAYNRWRSEHKDKERFSEYCVLINEVGAGNPDQFFNMIVPRLGDYDPTKPNNGFDVPEDANPGGEVSVNLPFLQELTEPMAYIMQISQKIHRKNRYSWKDPALIQEVIKPQTKDDIISNYHKEVSVGLNLRFSRTEWNELLIKSRRWNLGFPPGEQFNPNFPPVAPSVPPEQMDEEEYAVYALQSTKVLYETAVLYVGKWLNLYASDVN